MEIQFVGAAIDEIDGRGFTTHDLGGHAHDLPQQLVEVEGGGDRLADFEERGQFGHLQLDQLDVHEMADRIGSEILELFDAGNLAAGAVGHHDDPICILGLPQRQERMVDTLGADDQLVSQRQATGTGGGIPRPDLIQEFGAAPVIEADAGLSDRMIVENDGKSRIPGQIG